MEATLFLIIVSHFIIIIAPLVKLLINLRTIKMYETATNYSGGEEGEDTGDVRGNGPTGPVKGTSRLV